MKASRFWLMVLVAVLLGTPAYWPDRTWRTECLETPAPRDKYHR